MPARCRVSSLLLPLLLLAMPPSVAAQDEPDGTLALALGLTGCEDCSQADCAHQLQMNAPLATLGPVQVEVCREDTCFGPLRVATGDYVQLVDEPDLRIGVSRYFISETGNTLRVEATMGGHGSFEPPADERWTVRVVEGSSMLMDETATVTYERVYPNGESCGPTCFTAAMQLPAQGS